MKKIVLTAIASIIIPLLTTFTRKRKYVVRAAFDVDSGATEMCVAIVEKSKSKCVVRKVLYDDQTSILLRCDMSVSKDGKTLSESILSKTETTLKNYLNLAIETYGATQFCGIATAVFRKARNGEAFLKSLKKLGLEIKLIDQEMEGRIDGKLPRTRIPTLSITPTRAKSCRGIPVVVRFKSQIDMVICMVIIKVVQR